MVLLFYGLSAVLRSHAKAAWFAAALGHSLLQPVLVLTGLVLTIWGLLKSACCLAPRDATAMAPIRFCRPAEPRAQTNLSRPGDEAA